MKVSLHENFQIYSNIESGIRVTADICSSMGVMHGVVGLIKLFLDQWTLQNAIYLIKGFLTNL